MGHVCSFICDLTKKHYPEAYMRSHGVKAEILIEKTTAKSMKQRAKELKIKCRGYMTIDELAKAIETKSKGGDIKEIEALSRTRMRKAFAKWKRK
jgi:hypothetical protein